MSSHRRNRIKQKIKPVNRRETAREHVSEYQSSPIQNRKFRFQALGQLSGTDITAGILASLAGIATTTNALTPIYNNFKLNRVQIWSSGVNGDLKLDPIALKYYGIESGPSKTHSDYGNANRLAYLSVKPSVTDVANSWNNQASNNPVFNISLNSGDIIDVDLSIIFDAESTLSPVATVTTMSIGQPYYLYLDAGSITPVLEPSINTGVF